MCTAGVAGMALGHGKAFYAFFSGKTRKPLILKLKSEKNPATAVGKTSFMCEKRCFLLLSSCGARDFSKLFSDLNGLYAASGDSPEKNE